MKPPFERTVCTCAMCVDCCRRQPGPLVPGDFERIQEHLGATDEEMRRKFWRSPGALAMNLVTREITKIGTITPRRAAGKCVFLDDNDRCQIHAVAPAGCAYFDTHMGGKEAQVRANWMATAQRDEAYQKLRDTLPVATSYNPRRHKL